MRYQLKRKLGRGSFSEVWLAWDRQWEQDVALKLLPQCLRSDAGFVEAFQQAITRNHQLSQPAIARVLGFIRDLEVIGVEMEYVDGWSLAVLKMDRPQKRYRSEDLLPWLRQLCPALDCAHKEGMVHQDIQPANLLLNAREQVKLTDFGFAHLVRRALARQEVPFRWNIAFSSPQQAQGGEPGPLDDVYSLAATIYDLLTGTAPFYTGEVLAQVCEIPPPSMTQRLAELKIEDRVPEIWEEIIAACLAKEPSRRLQSAGELLRWLERKPAPKPAAPITAPGLLAAGFIVPLVPAERSEGHQEQGARSKDPPSLEASARQAPPSPKDGLRRSEASQGARNESGQEAADAPGETGATSQQVPEAAQTEAATPSAGTEPAGANPQGAEFEPATVDSVGSTEAAAPGGSNRKRWLTLLIGTGALVLLGLAAFLYFKHGK